MIAIDDIDKHNYYLSSHLMQMKIYNFLLSSERLPGGHAVKISFRRLNKISHA